MLPLALAMLTLPAGVEAGELRVAIRDGDGRPVQDAVVVATALSQGSPEAAPATAEVDQRNKEFLPYVLAVQAGTKVRFPNNDNIRHHVYSFSPAKTFELPLYAGTPAAPVVFDKPGVVILGCNIHDWMVGYVYVSESPHFAKSGGDGKATVADLPAGDYKVRIWHPRLAGDERATTVSVPASGGVDTSGEIRLGPDFRSRRAPTPGRGGY